MEGLTRLSLGGTLVNLSTSSIRLFNQRLTTKTNNNWLRKITTATLTENTE